MTTVTIPKLHKSVVKEMKSAGTKTVNSATATLHVAVIRDRRGHGKLRVR
jgi:hypothetical protein